jgi:hypothetical protein
MQKQGAYFRLYEAQARQAQEDQQAMQVKVHREAEL